MLLVMTNQVSAISMRLHCNTEIVYVTPVVVNTTVAFGGGGGPVSKNDWDIRAEVVTMGPVNPLEIIVYHNTQPPQNDCRLTAY